MKIKKMLNIYIIITLSLFSYDSLSKEKNSQENNKKRVQTLKEKKEKLELEQAIRELEFKKKISELTNEKKVLELENNLLLEKHKKETSLLSQKEKKLSLEQVVDKKIFQEKIRQLKQEIERQSLENEKLTQSNFELINTMKIESKKLEHELNMATMERKKQRQEVEKLTIDIEKRSKKEVWLKETNKEISYMEDPYKEDILRITDRRIQLNGSIVYGTAQYITERIHFFNNKSNTLPIFIVIDYSPGGSVMQGYRIVKAMQASLAPVYVVVKSFAASMAAVIATMADRSFAYKNAIILHHQPSSRNRGNLTEQKESVEIFEEWAKRLHTPVAKKMGLSLEEFYQKMYQANSQGDWKEFADNAQKLKWIDFVVDEIREEGIIKKPKSHSPRSRRRIFRAITEENENPVNIHNKEDLIFEDFSKLPKLKAFDMYFIYNTDKRYRW
ncbi:MAG: hypothetical protein CMP11_07410 [Zetaproteobacteria bacterium]|nr:hypothetical protein [Pseudobdellovibrionaceae bacterium]